MTEITVDKKGKVELTINNFLILMVNDKKYQGVRFNQLAQRGEVHDGVNPPRIWTDADAAESARYLEAKYGIYSRQKHEDALRILFTQREYNPLQDLVDGLEWDGENRCELFLTTWAKAADDPYTREVSRLIFAGGINRLYQPGCKFDVLPVLIGKQGAGKTMLVHWLALHDSYATITSNMSGDQKSIEALEGAWIAEVDELAALRTASLEALKSFITRTQDRYRRPWDKNVSYLPRRCIFIGSTNSRRFLTDQTGNRRFFPVAIESDGKYIAAHEKEVRAYIEQCWAEARERYKNGEMPPVPNSDLIDEYLNHQENAVEDDWRIGVIEQYLDQKNIGEKTCTKELYQRALYPDDPYRELKKSESRELGEILDNRIHGWRRLEGTANIGAYGKQRGWEKIAG